MGVFALLVALVVYFGALNGFQSLSIMGWVGYILVLVVLGLGGFAGFVMRHVGIGADAIEIDHQGFTAYRNANPAWSRRWDDPSLIIRLTVQRQPWPGWEGEPPVLYMRERGLRTCNLTPAAYEAILTEARAHELAFSSAPFDPPYSERISIRGRTPQSHSASTG